MTRQAPGAHRGAGGSLVSRLVAAGGPVAWWVLALAGVGLVSLVSLPYVVIAPGPVVNTLGADQDGTALIQVEGRATYPAAGALDFTTVRLFGGPGRKVTAWDVIGAWVDADRRVVDESDLFPEDVTAQQVQDANTAEMVGSQHEAAAAALRALGMSVPEVIDISEVSPDSSFVGRLQPGDRIVAIGGVTVTGLDDVRPLVQAQPPGAEVTVSVRRDGEIVEVTGTTGDVDGTAVLGVFLSVDFDFPVDVTIDAGDVGGPSAGMMFALGLYDVLTPGDLTGGADLAGTGTIDASGRVGPIGFIAQKLIGARDAGAQYFLAPLANCDAVTGHVPDGLTVVAVETLDEALSAVRSIAQQDLDALRSCPVA